MTKRKSDFTLPTNSLDELFSSQEERDDRHLWSRLGDVVRKIDNLVVPIVHVYSASPLLDKLELCV